MLLMLFECLGQAWKQLNPESVYSIDSFPIAVCDNIRIPRSKIYDGNEDQASKKRYFYRPKIQLMATASGEPVEFFLTSGSFADVRDLKVFPFALPESSVVYMMWKIYCLNPRISNSQLCEKAIHNNLYLPMFSFSNTISAK